MSEFLSALKAFFGSTSGERRRPRQLCDSVESLESRVLLSCVTASTDTQAVDVGGFESDAGNVVDCQEVHEVEAVAAVEEAGGATGDFDGSGAVTDLSQTFYLHSNPDATHTIYLDFDGHVTSGTSWNLFYNGGGDIVTQAYNFEGDSSSFTDNELARIQRIWQRVAEDFLPFDVDVTTEDPGAEALSKDGGGDSEWGIRVVIGGNGSWYGNVGGVTFNGSFNYDNDTPVFIFEDNLGNGNEKYTAEVISHEVGHSLGLSHDGDSSTSYYSGSGSGDTGWAPIMGLPYYKNLTQWSQGEYSGATNTQDDLAIITSQNGFGYRADDYGNTFGTAESFLVTSDNVNTTGIIEQNTDYDVFSFTTAAGNISFTASPSANGPNLDILLELYDANGNLVASANPSEQLGATLSLTVAAGTYYLRVSGTGKGDPGNGGYSDYGSLGFYSVTGTIVGSGQADTTGPRIISASSSGAVAGTIDTFTLTFSEAIADGTFSLADVTLTGPNGAITPTAVTKLSSTQYAVTFAPQSLVGTYTLTAGPDIADLAGNTMDQDQDGTSGEATDDQFSTTAAIADTTGPRVISSSSSGAATGTLDTFTVTFSEAIADGTFTLADVSLTGPNGVITPAAVTKLSSTQYAVTFAPQSAEGTYTLTIGPQILDLAGNAMDQDQDGIEGESLQDQFTSSGVLPEHVGPRVVDATASGGSADSLDTFTLTFSEAIADGTFTLADVTLVGPNGGITPTAVNKLSNTQYEVRFASQTAVGNYTLTVGPQIADLMGNLMDQDQDGVLGEAGDDQFTITTSIQDTTGPRVINSSFSGASAGTLDKVTLTFSESIADGTFTLADVTLTGPGGVITPTALSRLSGTQYEVTFAPQTTEGLYTLTVGPQVTDLAGNLMDQDQDGAGGEATQDQYTDSTVLQSAPTQWNFDFGSSSSLVESGYQQVIDSTSYSNSLGYGWTDGKVRSKARNGDALLEDFNWSDDATFAVDLPDGTYDVTMTLGDTRSDLNNVAVFLEGQQVDTVSTNNGEIVTLTYRVVVSDGQLTLRLQTSGGKRETFALSSLSIVNSSTAQAAPVPQYSTSDGLDDFRDDRRGFRSVIEGR